MTQIDFYTGSADKLRTACQLCHKAMLHGRLTAISLPDAASSDALDRLLWHYPDTAFIPHGRCDATNAGAAEYPVVLSHSGDNFPHHDMLINLSRECLPFFSRFDRVIEIVGTNDSHQGRERYKYYRDRGYEIRHFDLARAN